MSELDDLKAENEQLAKSLQTAQDSNLRLLNQLEDLTRLLQRVETVRSIYMTMTAGAHEVSKNDAVSERTRIVALSMVDAVSKCENLLEKALHSDEDLVAFAMFNLDKPPDNTTLH
jgi:hypothetical protein